MCVSLWQQSNKRGADIQNVAQKFRLKSPRKSIRMAKRLTEDDLDMGQMAEAELDRLQRQYRIMEGDRNAFCDDIYRSLRKQRKTIAVLTKERSNLQLNLTVIKNPLNALKDKQAAADLGKLLKKSSKYELDAKSRNSQLDELQQQIRRLEKELTGLRRKDITDTQSLSQAFDYKQTIETLENRLNVVSVKYNKQLAVNTRLRENLDHLLKERSHFNNLYQQMIARLNAGKKTMVDLIEQATIAYDQREEAQLKLQALRERSRQDNTAHGQEMRELMRKLDHDAKLQNFLGAKGQKRVMADLEAKEAAKKLAQREATEAKICEYRAVLRRLRELCGGEEGAEKLAAQFAKREEENFALFGYVGEINAELELIQTQVEEVQSRIDCQRLANRERAQQHQETLVELQARLEAGSAETAAALGKLDAAKKQLDAMLAGVEIVFRLARCSNAPILDLLGEETNVTRYNVMLFVGIIRRRVRYLSSAVAQEDNPTNLPDLVAKLKLQHRSSQPAQ